MLIEPDDRFFRDAFEYSPQGMLCLTPISNLKAEKAVDYWIISVNQCACDMLGRTKEQLQACALNEALPGIKSNGLLEQINNVHAADSKIVGEFVYKDHLIDLRFTLTATRTGPWIILSMLNVTRSHRSNKLARAFFDHAPDPMIITDEQGVIVSANHTVSKYIESPGFELVGTPLNRIIHAEDHEAAEEFLFRYSTAQTAPKYRFRLISEFSEATWFEWSRRLDSEEGLLYLNGHDINTQVRLEQERSSNLRRLQLFIENTPAAIAMFDNKGKYILCSDRWRREYHLPEGDCSGQTHERLCPYDTDRWQAIRPAITRGIRTSCEEQEINQPDGTSEWIRWELTPWTNEDGQSHGTLMISELITEKRRNELELTRQQWMLESQNRELEATRQAAEAASLAKSAFLANMSHEIRTPMTAILGFAEMLRESNITEDTRTDALNIIQNSGTYLLGIINDILDISKIEADKVELDLTTQCIESMINEATQMLSSKASSEGLDLNVCVNDVETNYVTCDELRIKQIVTNLVGNAIKFTPRGGCINVKLAVHEAPQTDNNGQPLVRMCLDVTDNGIGMTPEQAAKIFKPFSQADNSTTRTYGGTGLGLIISRKLAELMDGSLNLIHTEANRGSVFRLELTLPKASAASATKAELSNRNQSTDSHVWEHGHRILLVEDGLDNQKLISLFLQRAGAEVDIAENGQECLERIQDNPDNHYSLVLMDMQMPVMDGYTATRTLREKGFSTPIIAITAHALASDKALCLEAGCDDYCPKPIKRDDLIARCGWWLETRTESRAA